MESKALSIQEDQNKNLSFILHYRRMMEEIFKDEKVNPEFKKYIPLSYSLMNEKQSIYGGATGWMSYDFLLIETLWVDEAFRGKGLGGELLQKMEDEAKKNRCYRILTSTNSSSGSLDFWRKNGFELVYTTEKSPSGFFIYYLQKILAF